MEIDQMFIKPRRGVMVFSILSSLRDLGIQHRPSTILLPWLPIATSALHLH